MPDITELQSLGLNIEEITFDEMLLDLTNDLAERGRAKSKVERLKIEQIKNCVQNEQEEAIAQQKLMDLNDNIQVAKKAMGITGILKLLKF